MVEQLDELMDALTQARDIEAAARMDVKDRLSDEAKAARNRSIAESRLVSSIEQCRRARVAINDFIDWQTRSTIEEADELMEQAKLLQDKRTK